MGIGDRMSHKRKAINAKASQPKDVVKKEKPKIDYSKQMTDFQKIYKVAPLTNFELEQFKELLKLSNSAAAVMKDISEKEVTVIKMREIVRRMRTKEIKPPLLQEILPKTYAHYDDMGTAIKMINQQIKMTEDAIQFGKGQLGHRYEEYVDAMIRMKDRLVKLIGDATIKRISPHRIGAKTDAKETEVFEQGFEDFIKKVAKVEPKEVEKKK